jgi:cephalosporin hydroxylase
MQKRDISLQTIARGASDVVDAVRGRHDEIKRLKKENKQLRHALKTNGINADPAPPGNPRIAPALAVDRRLDDKAQATVTAFHRLYRDELRLDKQTYWRGARVIKCPLDLWVYQEIIAELQPDLIIETGTMYGGSAYYLASILDIVGHGEVLTIDINHRGGRPQHERITYLTGSSTAEDVVVEARRRARGKATVMVLLDSNHNADHVLDELRAYHTLVTTGSYLVVEDTNINGHPVEPDFGPGPMEALQTFLQENDDFEVDSAREKFLVTFNPSGWLRRKPV